ncbi:MAG: hypothetical protein KW802_00400 [Candidatus Doudnabacteria bacterium]|nr:hypothetical protein [Candidatus Doudnabacteria bacterium]
MEVHERAVRLKVYRQCMVHPRNDNPTDAELIKHQVDHCSWCLKQVAANLSLTTPAP